MNYDNGLTKRSETMKRSIMCHFIETNPSNITYLNLHNITLTESRTKHCSWIWTGDENEGHGDVFNVTLKQIYLSFLAPRKNSEYTDTMLALTCKACFKFPCDKNSYVTYAIPFILSSKTYNIEPFHSHNDLNICIVIFVVSFSFLLFFSFIVIGYRFLKKHRDKWWLS